MPFKVLSQDTAVFGSGEHIEEVSQGITYKNMYTVKTQSNIEIVRQIFLSEDILFAFEILS